MTFLVLIIFCITNIISLVKKRIDPVEEDADGDKYKEGKEGEPKKAREEKREESSMMAFDQNVISMKAQKIEEDDPTGIKIVKKTEEFEGAYFPLLILFCLNIITGTSKAFSFVNYLFTLIAVILFNVLKAHRQCCNHICVNVVLDNLWLILLFFEILNVWAATPVAMPYAVISS